VKNIFISCGEVSGDIYAGGIIRELLTLNPSLKIWGMLGEKSVNAGGFAKWSYEELKLMGLFEIIPSIPRLLKLKRTITREILSENPDAVILTDCPDFHLMLAKGLRKSGYNGKIISLIPPTVWAWRSGRVKNLRRDFDFCLPLFSFEHEFLLKHGVKSLWQSHPLVKEIESVGLSQKFRERFEGGQIIALMPGSRRYDIKFHLDTLIKTAEILKSGGYSPVFSIAEGLSPDLASELRERLKNCDYWDGSGRELMLGSLASVGVSGTVSVEAMLLGRFMTVIYNMNRVNYMILKRLVKVKYISIPNLLSKRMIYPELLCEKATPSNIAREVERYLNDEDYRSETDTAIKSASEAMGHGDAFKFWAETVLRS